MNVVMNMGVPHGYAAGDIDSLTVEFESSWGNLKQGIMKTLRLSMTGSIDWRYTEELLIVVVFT